MVTQVAVLRNIVRRLESQLFGGDGRQGQLDQLRSELKTKADSTAVREVRATIGELKREIKQLQDGQVEYRIAKAQIIGITLGVSFCGQIAGLFIAPLIAKFFK